LIFLGELTMSTNIHPCVKELSETALNLDADYLKHSLQDESLWNVFFDSRPILHKIILVGEFTNHDYEKIGREFVVAVANQYIERNAEELCEANGIQLVSSPFPTGKTPSAAIAWGG
jgi:hypothetical protein